LDCWETNVTEDVPHAIPEQILPDIVANLCHSFNLIEGRGILVVALALCAESGCQKL
jgi:hypothetical protein